MTHSKTPLPSCRLIRSPSNLARRKNINFDSVPRSSRKLPGSCPGNFPQKGRKPAKWILRLPWKLLEVSWKLSETLYVYEHFFFFL